MTRKLTPGAWMDHEIEKNGHTADFELEQLLLDLEQSIWRTMQAKSISRSDLAERLATSRAFITKLLSGHENLTLKTLVRVANALEMKIDMRFVGRQPQRRRPRQPSAAKRSPSSGRGTSRTRSPKPAAVASRSR